MPVLLALLVVLHLADSVRAQSGPAVPVNADLLLRGRPAEGLVVLQSGVRDSPLVRADALVFMDVSSDLELGGDVLVMTVELREPHGYGFARLGRFILSAGAVRPVQIDGASVSGRAPTGTSLQLFAGVPVMPDFGSRAFDWLVGARAGQDLLDERLSFGASYLHRRDAGQVADDEVGADLALQALSWLSLSALGAWDVTARGLAEARAAAIAHDGADQVELFVSHRVAARLLPATSLFSVISEAAGTRAGASASVRAYPKLDVGGSATLEGLADELGYGLGLRGTLFFGEQNAGRVGLEGTRRKLGHEGWTGASAQLWLPLLAALRAHASVELVAADHPGPRGSVWPWTRLGASYAFTPEWHVAAAAGIKATPYVRHETYGLFRVAYHAEVLP